MGLFDFLLGGNWDAKLKAVEKEIAEGPYETADEMLTGLRSAANKKGTPATVVIRIDLLEGRLRWKYKLQDRAEPPLKRAFAAAQQAGERDMLRDAAGILIECAVAADKHREIPKLVEQWLVVAPSDMLVRADMLLLKAGALCQIGQAQDGLLSYVAAQRMVEALPESEGRGQRLIAAVSGAGDAYLAMDDKVNAINSWRHALTLTQAQMGENHPQVAAILTCIGAVQMSQDQLDPAITAFSQALDVYRACRQAESTGACMALQKISLAYLMRRDYQRAELHAQDAVRVAGSCGSSELLGQAQDLIRRIEFARPVEARGQATAAAAAMPADPPTSGRNPLAARNGLRTRSQIAGANWQSFAPMGPRT